MKGKLHLRRDELPSELRNLHSDLNRLAMVAGDMADARLESAQAVINKTRTLLHQACPRYMPSRVGPIICRSGEDTGRPYRGALCAGCVVGQFSPRRMIFVGEITAPPRPVEEPVHREDARLIV